MSNKDKIAVQKDPLSAESVAFAAKELRETPEQVKQSIAELRELLKGEKSLKYDDTDRFLTYFLRPVKFYPDSALALMKRAAEFREKNASILKNLVPKDEYTTLVENNVVNILADRDQDGRRILILNVGEIWDPSKVKAEQIFRCVYLLSQIAALEPETQVKGIVVIMDYKGMGMKHVTALGPSFAKLLLTFIQDALPLRLKEVHFINQSLVFDTVFQIFKPFIKEKLRKRLFFHGKDIGNLQKHINPANLPEDYGGKLPKIDYSSADWYKVMEEHTPIFEKWNTYGIVKS